MKKVFMIVLIGLVLTSAVFAACSVEFISNDYSTKLLLASHVKTSEEVLGELSKHINLDKGILTYTDNVDYATGRSDRFLNDELFNSVMEGYTIYMFNNDENIMTGTFRNAQFVKFLFGDKEYSSDSISLFDLLY